MRKTRLKNLRKKADEKKKSDVENKKPRKYNGLKFRKHRVSELDQVEAGLFIAKNVRNKDPNSQGELFSKEERKMPRRTIQNTQKYEKKIEREAAFLGAQDEMNLHESEELQEKYS
ncbi:hypothetical protein JTB14_021340 [Gonioctena quinquepunctata]|nr:hypothetical protein JTB14_021340 [Gonioctena quinquepunctata]